MKNEVLNLKDQAFFCFLSSIAVFLTIPNHSDSYGFVHILLSILAIIVFFLIKSNYIVKTLCISVFFNSIYSAISIFSYHYIPVFLSGNFFYCLYYIFAVAGPVLYLFFKSKEKWTKIYLVIILITLLLHLFSSFVQSEVLFYLLDSFSIYVSIASLFLFFLSSYFNTSDKSTQYISIAASISSLFILIVTLIRVVIDFRLIGLAGLDAYDLLRGKFLGIIYSSSAVAFINYSSSCILVAAIVMAIYFANLLKRSKMWLKSVSIPAIIAMLLLGLIIYTNASNYYTTFSIWGNSDFAFVLFLAYLFMAYSFYKFYNTL